MTQEFLIGVISVYEMGATPRTEKVGQFLLAFRARVFLLLFIHRYFINLFCQTHAIQSIRSLSPCLTSLRSTGTHLKKARLQAYAQACRSGLLRSPGGYHMTLRGLFRREQIPPTTGFRITNSTDPRRLTHSKIWTETRGSKKKLSERDIRYVETLLWRAGYDGRILSWDTLAIEASLEVSARTLQRAMVQKDWRRCLACRRS